MRRRSSRVRIMPSISKSNDSGEDSEMDYDGKKGWREGGRRESYSLSSRKRSQRLRQKAALDSRRKIRKCRLEVLAHSSTDDMEEEELMFATPRRRLRNYHNSSTVNTKSDEGIRRSTRIRKLRYENSNDSWIFGDATVRGYPSYGANYSKGKVKVKEREDDGSEEEEEEEEEEEGMQTEERGEGERARSSRQPRASQSRGREEESGRNSSTERQQAGQRQGSGTRQSKENGEISRRTREMKPGNAVAMDTMEETTIENGFEDMYARVKQRRRAAVKFESSSESERSSDEEDGSRRPKMTLTRRPARRSELQQLLEQSSSRRSELTRLVEQSTADGPPSQARQYALREKKEIARGSSYEDSSSFEQTHRKGEARPPGSTRIRYLLRQKKPTVQRFQAEVPPSRRDVFREVVRFRQVRGQRRRRPSSSSSTTSSSDSGRAGASSRPIDPRKSEGGHRGRDHRSRDRKRLELLGGDTKNSNSLADVDPLSLDRSITFENVGGLESHISSLKEMVVFPMLYPEVFNRFGVTPPKGVLFHGPPGTGKTLIARALANECSAGQKKVSFFMRKGADVLCKYVGESERQLRILFENAKAARPSIIFFDELDGLAPVRSTKQDQIHASIVCTLLALMDGLDSRGDIIVIGATNRIDSIDPALRRPGRFDRELHFPLPGVKERREILEVHAGKWAEKEILNRLAETTVGFCGSDLKALCTESVIQALRRVYPQIYTSSLKLLLNPDKLQVTRADFERAQRGIVPASQRSTVAAGRKLPRYLEPLLGPSLANILSQVAESFPAAFNKSAPLVLARSPRLAIVGRGKEGSLLAAGLLYKLEHCPTLSLSLDFLYGDSSKNPTEAMTSVFRELAQNRGSVLWFGELTTWWSTLGRSTKAVFSELMAKLDPTLPILFLAVSIADLPPELDELFSEDRCEVFRVPRPTTDMKEAFFRPLFRIRALKPPPSPKKPKDVEALEVAPPSPPPKMSEEELKAVYDQEENTLRELRIFLRQICAKLARNKQFYMFSKPVDINEVPDYHQIIKEPMDLETMMTKIDLHKYACAEDFLRDVDLLCKNALEYNPDRDPADKLIRHRACYLRDTAYALIKAEMDSDFEVSCRSIRDARQKRKEVPSQRFIQEFFKDEEEGGKVKEKSAGVSGEAEEGGGEEQTSAPPPTTPPTGDEAATSSNGRRKVRRPGKWSKGIVKRPVKRLKQSPDSSKDTDQSASRGEDTHVETADAEREIKMEVGAEQNCAENSVTPLRAPSGEGRDETEFSETDAEKEISDEKRLSGMSETRLRLLELLAETVTSCEQVEDIERLMDLYLSLRLIIDRHRPSVDRNPMIQDLEEELKKFQTRIS